MSGDPCTRCGQPRKRHRLCDDCRRAENLTRERRCTRCGDVKPGREFPASSNGGAWCKPCAAEQMRERRRTMDPAEKRAMNRERYDRRQADPRARRLRYYARMARKYGVSRDDVLRMIREAEGRCALCVIATPDLVFDHCHESGRVRGLLCQRCNVALGALGDTPEAVAGVLAYLLSAEPAGAFL